MNDLASDDEPPRGAHSCGLAIETLDARVELRHGRMMNALLFLPKLLVGLIRYSLLWGRPEIGRACSVVVFRKADGAELLKYNHRFVAETYDQLADLVGRLGTESASSLARDLGIPEERLQTLAR